MLQGQITGYPTLCDIWSIYSSWFVSRPHCRGDNYDNGHQQLWLRGCEGQWHNLMGRCPARHPRTKYARSKSDQTRSFDMFPRRKLQSEIQLEASEAECPLMYLFNHLKEIITKKKICQIIPVHLIFQKPTSFFFINSKLSEIYQFP